MPSHKSLRQQNLKPPITISPLSETLHLATQLKTVVIKLTENVTRLLAYEIINGVTRFTAVLVLKCAQQQQTAPLCLQFREYCPH